MSEVGSLDRPGSRDDLYERDFYAWTRAQVRALEKLAATRPNLELDLPHLIEEVRDLGSEQLDELESAYRVLLLHLLKWKYQPEGRSGSWRGSIVEQRRRALRLIRRNPGMKPKRQRLFAEAYEDARLQAAAETGLPLETLPETAPFTLEQALDEAFWPEP
ncbi:MAG: hypothetical protein KatS3mg117_0764 [Geminicoccaceae bacterium]|nr:MAG: hypothetical protein KatS3mg117_0764 [Geminicoccaceae bacterium]